MSKLTQEEVLRRMSYKHNNNYDYSKFVYIKSNQKSIIICRIHGEFLMSYDCHYIAGQACPKCWNERRYLSRLKPMKWYINKANIIRSIHYFINPHSNSNIRNESP